MSRRDLPETPRACASERSGALSSAAMENRHASTWPSSGSHAGASDRLRRMYMASAVIIPSLCRSVGLATLRTDPGTRSASNAGAGVCDGHDLALDFVVTVESDKLAVLGNSL